ncbi:MAG: MFS transporter [Nanoarchaeota archaeon]|nr:MAG: MFS transporter [Nanoarchaeota archaeon]
MAKKINVDSHEEKTRKSLVYSILDGSFYSLMAGFGESFFSAFAIFLKASNMEIGLIGSLPQALGAIAQLFSTKLIKLFHSRKKPILINAFLEGIMFVPMLLTFFMGKFRVIYFLLFVCLYWIFGMLINPAWMSWMGDLVKPNERGKYFGRRNKFTGFFTLVALLISGYILLTSMNNEYFGFVIIFGIAMVARLFSSFFLSMMYDPGVVQVPGSSFSLIEFIKKARYNNYGLFVFFLTSMNFSVYLAAPFFAAYMLKDLHLDYFTYTLIIAVPIVVKFFTNNAWGSVSDRFGSRKILTMTALLISINPILWLFSKNILYLILIQAYSGFVWAGFELSTFNFILDCTSTVKRATAVSYFNLLNGFAMLAGALAGGFMLMFNFLFWSQFYFVFLLSTIARFAVAVFFIPKIHEMRHVQKSTYKDILVSMFQRHAHATMGKAVPIHQDRKR